MEKKKRVYEEEGHSSNWGLKLESGLESLKREDGRRTRRGDHHKYTAKVRKKVGNLYPSENLFISDHPILLFLSFSM